MIEHDVEQGSLPWYRLRLGMPTASLFHRIITPKTWQPSAQARGYAFQLAAEILLNEIADPLNGIEAMERGKELEPQAVDRYEFGNAIATRKVGFLTDDARRIGASPDRLILGEPGAVEIKCPSARVQLEYLIDGFEADYLPQVMGQMLVGEFDFVDRFAYHPRTPPVFCRTYRDDAKIKTLAGALANFLEVRDEIIEKARAEGYFAERPRLATAIDQAYGDDADRLSPGEMG